MDMLAAVLYGPRDVRMERVPIPEPGRGEVLVRVGAATTCGTDAKVYVRGEHPKMITPPAIFGHEFSGTVDKVGPGGSKWKRGQRVVAANSAPCGRCFFCRKELPELCEDLLFMNGAYAQYALVPERIAETNLREIPESVPFEHASLAEPLACVVHGFEQIPVSADTTVAVNGAGPIGLFFLQLLKAAKARVIQSDSSPGRLDIARLLGADEVVNICGVGDQVSAVRGLTDGGRGADIAIEAVGIPEVWEKTVKMVRKGGLALLFGGCPSGTTFRLDTASLHYDELTVKGAFHHTPRAFRRALEMLSSGIVNAGAMITARFPLEKVADALQMILDHRGVKSAVIPPE
ncbi:MAG TPA: zinc-binding dehydrogenase [Candidatus Brocadiia bacterium]|nr:zinc-binding dehydrogenase [Candidatus Brocadiia bacterium]